MSTVTTIASRLKEASPDLDHVILVVDDLDRAAGLFTDLGFTVTPRSDHPFGTANRLIVFDNNFIELLASMPGAALGPYRVVSDFLAANDGPGPWGIVWATTDAANVH